MQMTPQDLWALRNIVIRAVNDTHKVLATAARREQSMVPREVVPATPSPPPSPPPPPPKPRLTYPLTEAASLLGLSKATLYRLIDRGELKAVCLESRRLIEAIEIEALLVRARQVR